MNASIESIENIMKLCYEKYQKGIFSWVCCWDCVVNGKQSPNVILSWIMYEVTNKLKKKWGQVFLLLYNFSVHILLCTMDIKISYYYFIHTRLLYFIHIQHVLLLLYRSIWRCWWLLYNIYIVEFRVVDLYAIWIE